MHHHQAVSMYPNTSCAVVCRLYFSCPLPTTVAVIYCLSTLAPAVEPAQVCFLLLRWSTMTKDKRIGERALLANRLSPTPTQCRKKLSAEAQSRYWNRDHRGNAICWLSGRTLSLLWPAQLLSYTARLTCLQTPPPTVGRVPLRQLAIGENADFLGIVLGSSWYIHSLVTWFAWQFSWHVRTVWREQVLNQGSL